MKFFDTHIHLDFLLERLESSSDVFFKQLELGSIQYLLSLSIAKKNFKHHLQLITEFPEYVYAGLGLHPLYIEEHQQEDLDILEKLLSARYPNIIALGEIGLERYHEHLIRTELWRKQCDFFEAQLLLAQQYSLPISIHIRRSKSQVLSFLKNIHLDRTGIIHGFSGSYEEAKQFIDLGYKIGVGGVITYERAKKTRQAISRLPLECLVLETDSPDMPVFGYQGQINTPLRLPIIFESLCCLRKEKKEDLAQQIFYNSCHLFNIITPISSRGKVNE